MVHPATQARARAAQMHLNCITILTALPITFSCCEKHRPLPAAAAFAEAPKEDISTDEYEREWIYDTGAAKTMIGYNWLTNVRNLVSSTLRLKTT